MGSVSRKALAPWIAWWVVRRRLRRSDHALAALGVVGLELVGPRIFRIRPVLVVALGLTVVGLVALGLVWLILRRRGGNGGDWGQDEPELPPAPEPPATHVDEPVVPVGA